MLKAERQSYIALKGAGNRNLFDHMHKLNLPTHKSPISSDNQGPTIYILLNASGPNY